ncbi:hypothetical protein SDC9_176369 [bioreactor metagenome]|uniref:Uncharacterized protein n=1 Tax=bioreactor metagenome TaxID=1076179 RepID=A0A645GZ73_9ZZZZ
MPDTETVVRRGIARAEAWPAEGGLDHRAGLHQVADRAVFDEREHGGLASRVDAQ